MDRWNIFDMDRSQCKLERQWTVGTVEHWKKGPLQFAILQTDKTSRPIEQTDSTRGDTDMVNTFCNINCMRVRIHYGIAVNKCNLAFKWPSDYLQKQQCETQFLLRSTLRYTCVSHCQCMIN